MELSHRAALDLKACPPPPTSTPDCPRPQGQAGQLHFPWARRVLERAVSSLAVGTRAGRDPAACKARKYFPLYNGFQTSNDKQSDWQ